VFSAKMLRPHRAEPLMTNPSTLHFDWALLPDGWGRDVRVTQDGGRIAAIETGVPADGAGERHAVGLPGLGNGHSHAFQRAMAGLTEWKDVAAASFWSWRDTLYRFLGAFDPGDVEAVTAQAYVEMLEAGFTRVGEFHYLHHDANGREYADIGEMAARVAAAAADTGIALTLLPVFYAHAGFGGTPPTAGQRRFVCSFGQYERLLAACEAATARLPDAVVGVAPHSLRAVDESKLRVLERLRPRDPLHLHIAEQTQEVEDCVAWSGQRPVEWLLDRFPVDARWSLIHATHVTPIELARMVESRATVGLCPITEANLGDGVFPAAELLDAGGSFSVGSDSNVTIDAAGELRLLEYGQRLAHRARNVLATPGGHSTGRAVFERALAGGAQSLGVPVAGLYVGGPADLVSLDAGAGSFVAKRPDQWLDHWIFAARRPSIDCVWRAGRKLVQGGRHGQAEPIARRYREVLTRLVAKLD
jgi:formiminoglutamate deiminase